LHEQLNEALFSSDGGLGLHIPQTVAARYHLAAGVEVQVVQTEEGILLRPVGVEPWFSIEWEHALDDVLHYYGAALEQIGE
jgi:hypothetical protein